MTKKAKKDVINYKMCSKWRHKHHKIDASDFINGIFKLEKPKNYVIITHISQLFRRLLRQTDQIIFAYGWKFNVKRRFIIVSRIVDVMTN